MIFENNFHLRMVAPNRLQAYGEFPKTNCLFSDNL